MGVFIKLVKWSFPVLSSKLSNIFIGTPSTFLSGFILQSTALYLAHKDFFLLLMFIHLFSNLSDSSNLHTTNELGLNVNISLSVHVMISSTRPTLKSCSIFLLWVFLFTSTTTQSPILIFSYSGQIKW